MGSRRDSYKNEIAAAFLRDCKPLLIPQLITQKDMERSGEGGGKSKTGEGIGREITQGQKGRV